MTIFLGIGLHLGEATERITVSSDSANSAIRLGVYGTVHRPIAISSPLLAQESGSI